MDQLRKCLPLRPVNGSVLADDQPMSTVVKFKADITLTSDEKVSSSLDECLLDEDIGGFVGSYLFDVAK